jgi:hypothetical protein
MAFVKVEQFLCVFPLEVPCYNFLLNNCCGALYAIHFGALHVIHDAGEGSFAGKPDTNVCLLIVTLPPS